MSLYSLSGALGGLSIDSTGLLELLPVEISLSIAEFHDHESLVCLGATCSSLRKFVLNDVNSLWTMLHDKRWTSGKRLRVAGPPSKRPRDRIVDVDDNIDWHLEFSRRFTLDKSVPGRLAKLPAEDSRDVELASEEHTELLATLLIDGADIYDKLKLLSGDSEYSYEAKDILVRINRHEASNDWINLRLTLAGDNIAGYEDGTMVLTKYCQTAEDLVHRISSDEIYDEMNLELDELTVDDLGDFEYVDLMGGIMDSVLLDKVLKNRKGNAAIVANVELRVTYLDLSISSPMAAEWWHAMRTIVVAQCLARDSTDGFQDAMLIQLHFPDLMS